MRKSFNLRGPQTIVRGVLGALLSVRAPGRGRPGLVSSGQARLRDLEAERISLDAQLKSARATVGMTRRNASAVEKGRAEDDDFLNQHFLTSRTAFSTLLRLNWRQPLNRPS